MPHRHAHIIEHRLLHRNLNFLPPARTFTLYVRGEHPTGRMNPGAGVTDRGSRPEGRGAWKSSHRHRTAGGLCNWVEAFELAVGTVGAEAFDRQVDELRINLVQPAVAQSPALERTQGVILGEDVDLL